MNDTTPTPAFIETFSSPTIERLREEATGEDPIAKIRLALVSLRERAKAYQVCINYYDGFQPLNFASDRYQHYFGQMVRRYRENLCPGIVDSLTDRLQVTGAVLEAQLAPESTESPIPAGEQQQPGQDPDAAANAALWAIWKANRMAVRAGRIHKEAVKVGDAFVIVWKDPLIGSARFYVQDSRRIHCHYDPETEICDWAAKFWIDETKRGRCVLYFPDRIERYVTAQAIRPVNGLPGDKAAWQPDGEIMPNPQDRVPVFHFANDADLGEYGQSELRDVMPIQDGLNKSVADMLVAMEFAAYPQRWGTGIQTETNPVTGREEAEFEPGIDRLWKAGDEMAKFGEFAAADLDKFINVTNRFKAAAADVVGVPAHYMQMTPGNWPSGESLKTAEARFVAKTQDRQNAFGAVWAEALTFAAAINGVTLDRQIEIVWQDASPRSEIDAATVAGIKVSQIGVSKEQAQRELGYTEEQIQTMGAEAEAAAELEAERQAQRLNQIAGNFGEDE